MTSSRRQLKWKETKILAPSRLKLNINRGQQMHCTKVLTVRSGATINIDFKEGISSQWSFCRIGRVSPASAIYCQLCWPSNIFARLEQINFLWGHFLKMFRTVFFSAQMQITRKFLKYLIHSWNRSGAVVLFLPSLILFFSKMYFSIKVQHSFCISHFPSLHYQSAISGFRCCQDKQLSYTTTLGKAPLSNLQNNLTADDPTSDIWLYLWLSGICLSSLSHVLIFIGYDCRSYIHDK